MTRLPDRPAHRKRQYSHSRRCLGVLVRPQSETLASSSIAGRLHGLPSPWPSVSMPGPAGGDRRHPPPLLLPVRLCVPLQGAKSFHNPSQGRRSCILATRRGAPSNAALNPRVSSGPPGRFPSVDLSSGAGALSQEGDERAA